MSESEIGKTELRRPRVCGYVRRVVRMGGETQGLCAVPDTEMLRTVYLSEYEQIERAFKRLQWAYAMHDQSKPSGAEENRAYGSDATDRPEGN